MATPQEEIFALHSVSGLSIAQVARLAQVSPRILRSFLLGIAELSLDQLVAVRQVLTDRIREQVAASDKGADRG